MYIEGLLLNNLQWSICYKTKPNQTKPNPIYSICMYKEDLALTNSQWLRCHKTKLNKSIALVMKFPVSISTFSPSVLMLSWFSNSLISIFILNRTFLSSFLTICLRVRRFKSNSFRFLPEFCFSVEVFSFFLKCWHCFRNSTPVSKDMSHIFNRLSIPWLRFSSKFLTPFIIWGSIYNWSFVSFISFTISFIFFSGISPLLSRKCLISSLIFQVTTFRIILSIPLVCSFLWLIIKLLNKVHTMQKLKVIIFHWIPSLIRIKGRHRTYSAAKSTVIMVSDDNLKIPYTDIKVFAKEYIRGI